jgi:outer membrane protein TolC
MLRITVHDDTDAWRLQLEGKLAAALVAEAQTTWASRTARKRIVVDLTGVTVVDDAGCKLLEEMNQAGAQFVAGGVEMKALVSEIKGESKGKWSCKKACHLVGVLALVMWVQSVAVKAQGISATAQGSPSATVRLTLKDAVALALRQNPEVAIANLNLVERGENRKIARSALLPQATAEAAQQVNRENVASLFGESVPGFPGHTGPFWTTRAGGTVSAPLLDLTLWRRWQAARESVHTADMQRITARELNAQLVVSQYLGSLRTTADVKAAESRRDLAKALFDLATDLQKSGVGTGIDTLRANVQYQNERQRYSEAETQRKIELYGLGRLLNLDPSQNVELADASSFFETPAVNQDASLTQAYEARPEMKTVLSEMRANEFQKRAARSERLPRVSAEGGWSLFGLGPSNMIPVYEFGATVQVPLFTGGRIGAEEATADIELKKLQQTERDLRNQIAVEVKSAVAQLDAARVEVEAANLGVNLAQESVRQAQDRFRAGVANNIEVITAQDELARANDNQITALYRYNQSRADLARATGRMEALYAQ